MRLIDADELKNRIVIDSDLVEISDGVMVPCIDFEYNIDFAPTVEAIPIEWLKENYGGLQIVRYIMKDWEINK